MRNLIGLLVCGLLGLTSTPAHAATLESPAPGANVSGLGYIAGWKCHHGEVTIRIDGGGPIRTATRMPRADTQAVCQGATDNGFITQFNWAFLADGSHTVVAYDNGVEFARSTFTVATFGEEFVVGAQGECTMPDLPSPGETARFVWNESTQHLELSEGSIIIDPDPERALASHGRFHVIRHELSEAQDHDAECRARLGSGFRLADWNDIVSYHQEGGSLSTFTTGLRMVPPNRRPLPGELGNGYRISRDGDAIWSGRRHYFVARHDHNKPSSFLDHANLDNHHVSLGSWYGTGGYALCYGDGGEPDIAPADQAAFDRFIVGKRIINSDNPTDYFNNPYYDFPSAGRYSVTFVNSASGTYSYRKTGPNTFTLTLNSDAGSSCTYQATLTSTTTGTAVNNCFGGRRTSMRIIDTSSPPMSGFAPADQAAWIRLVAGKRVVNANDSADYFAFSANGRFTYYFHGSQVSGTYGYRKTGPNTAEVAVTSDGGISCTYRATFTSATTGTAVEDCSGDRIDWQIIP